MACFEEKILVENITQEWDASRFRQIIFLQKSWDVC